MGRELRKVPKNFQHPKLDNGNWQPMFEDSYLEAIEQWYKEHKEWLNGVHTSQNKDYKFYAEYSGNPPSVEYYNTFYTPNSEECTHYMLYENTSEGTPCSPAFATIEELAEYAEKNCTTFAYNKATKSEWLQMLTGNNVYHQEGNAIFM